jgi:UDP-glucose 4-epimerase
MFWKNKKIFVTGAGGFLGSSLIRKLKSEGADITALLMEDEIPKEDIRIVRGNLLQENFSFPEFDYVFHLAALVGVKKCEENPSLARGINISGSEKISRFTMKGKNLTKFIYFSTAQVYGDCDIPVTEECRTNPENLYSQTKLEGEKKIIDNGIYYRIPTAIVRMSNIYGPEQGDSVIPLFIEKIKKDGRVEVTESNRDFIYVDDVIDGALVVAEKGEGIYNLGTGQQTKIRDVAEIIAGELGKEVEIAGIEDKNLKSICLNINKIKKLGWNPRYSIEEGLKKILTWKKK